jgi:hypothetical protein
MKSIVVTIFGLGIAVIVGLFVWDRLAEKRPDIIPDPENFIALPASLTNPSQAMKTIYLNREGAVLRPGQDDASKNRSSIVAHLSTGRPVRIPAFSGSAARWRAIAKCIRKQFSSFDVNIVEQRPVDDDNYLMAVFGGHAGLVGKRPSKGRHTTGLSPFTGKPVRRAVVLVFSKTLRNSVRNTCETAGMEIGHAYGLDHGYHCRDLMTYLGRCGSRIFLDKDLHCGEHQRRVCFGGEPRQNSHKWLARTLGLRKKFTRR